MSTRPAKHAPAPLSSAAAGALYCHTCGRVISPRKSHLRTTTPPKFCSDKCRARRLPASADSMQKDIEATFVKLLNRQDHSPSIDQGVDGKRTRGRVKGDGRKVVLCVEVQEVVFGDGDDIWWGKGKARKKRGVEVTEWKSVDMEEKTSTFQHWEGSDSDNAIEDDEVGGVPICLPSEKQPQPMSQPPRPKPLTYGDESSAHSSIRDNKPPTKEDDTARQKGMQRAEERELVRQAARRGVAFGFVVGEGEQRAVEAVQGNRVVEASFAKGEWGVRWRE